ncbi:MAG: penicillin-binding protein 2 [Steroidobacteraceae bacterium]
MNSNVRIKDLWKEQRIYSNRTVAALFIIGLLSLLLIGQLVWLQIFQHDYYLELSQGNRVRLDPIPASRGLILDRNGKILADNEPGYQLELVREQTPDLAETLNRLVSIGLLSADELDETRRAIMARRSFDSVPIRLRMTDEEIGRFAVHRHEFPGVDLVTRQTRHYPYGELAVHALGYVGAISEQDLQRIDRSAYNGTTLIGKTGVEASYEKELHGKNGYREILVNAQGRSVQRVGAYSPVLESEIPTSGTDVLTSLDLETQQAAEDGLGSFRGAVVAIDPDTGDVLALASKPGFDPGLFARGLTRAEYASLTENIDKPLLNRALRGAYPAGSTIKPFMGLAGLEYKVVNPDETEFCRGYFMLPGSSRRYRDWKELGHGNVNLYKAIAQSCDVYFYGLARTLGVDRIATFLDRFGFGAVTGIDIGGEKAGILPSPQWKKQTFKRAADQVWYPGETINFGIGQGYLTVTPVELAHATALIAARGRNYAPRLITGTRDSSTGQVVMLPPKSAANIDDIAPESWDAVVQGMVDVVKQGTATSTPVSKAIYSVAAKTGTAQVYSLSQSASNNGKAFVAERLRNHGWFIAFAPVDHPKIAVAVLLENASHGTAAAPIARKVMDAYLLKEVPVSAVANPAPAAASAPPAGNQAQ